ncbi:uncharacterized protein GIQ15_05270 [Arthroderma uncinatum]|uniref:uncharacterized protein n=1 Tax=Arthroderma uncinatum TaxID=74035 RepID=UPI00144AE89C|nr:uncharacterized protein GIQ15_05270 [Arthroderma uncinatum]KAF3482511.1 hypothetical protein GIQ15_05270 [Arthroderma uncinatum]
MNCPSRTDEDLVHPDWNQNPPFLPPDLTKREDLNGRVNDRQGRNGRDLSSSSLECPGGAFESHVMTIETTPSPATAPFADAKLARYREEFCSATKETPSMAHGLTAWIHHFNRWLLPYQSYIWWMTATIFTTLVVYCVGDMFRTFFPTSQKIPMQKTKRASTCGTGGVNAAEYNLPLHVIALFIIMFVSSFACGFPMLVLKYPRLHIPQSFFFAVRHFGTGVLIATAFVHLLPTAFTSLGNPCLSGFWTSDYPAMPGAIALAAVFLVTIIEMVFSPAQHVCGGTSDVEKIVCTKKPSNERQPSGLAGVREDGRDSRLQNAQTDLTRSLSRRERDSLSGRASSIGRELNRMKPSGQPGTTQVEVEDDDRIEDGSGDELPQIVLSPEQKRQKAFMQCILLEVGILFHSVFIGMALSVSVGSKFVILLIAITFHQSFEGLALGSRIASLDWEPNAIQPWLMALAYGCTTPAGQAIGLATHTLYSPDSEIGLIMVGTMNAISSGLLVYASLVELLSEDFLSDESWRVLRGKRRVFACILVFLGAFEVTFVTSLAQHTDTWLNHLPHLHEHASVVNHQPPSDRQQAPNRLFKSRRIFEVRIDSFPTPSRLDEQCLPYSWLGSKRGSGTPFRGRSTRGGHRTQGASDPVVLVGNGSNAQSQGHPMSARGGRGRGTISSPFGAQSRGNFKAGDGSNRSGFTGFRKSSSPPVSQTDGLPASNPFGPKSNAQASSPFGSAARGRGNQHATFGQARGGRGSTRGFGAVDRARDPRRRPATTPAGIKPADSIADYTTRYERHVDPDSGESSNMEGKMIKRFRRSAAGKDEQLPSDIRSPKTLLQTINYMLRHVTTSDETLGSIHKFVWDRTRSVRNDLSIQQVSQRQDIDLAVKCFERIARFHILSLHLLSNPTNQEQFDHHQEREQLNNTLLSLLYYYDDNHGRLEFPNEAEFRAYYILFSIHDQRPDLEARVQKWPRELRESLRVQVAMEMFAAAGNTWEYQGTLDAKRQNPLAQGFYSRFFQLVRSKSVSYLMACVAEVYFNQVRQTAIRSIWKAYCRQPASQQHKNQEWTIDELTIALAFDNDDQTIAFCEEQDLQLATNAEGQLYLNWANRPIDSIAFQPSSRQTFSYQLVEQKRCGRSLAAVILGMSVSQAIRHKMIDTSLLQNELYNQSVQADEEGLFVSDDENQQQQPAHAVQPSPFETTDEPLIPSTFNTPSFGGPVSQFGQSSPFGSPFNSQLSPAASPFSPQNSSIKPISQFGQPSPAHASTPSSSSPTPPMVANTGEISAAVPSNSTTFSSSFPSAVQTGFGSPSFTAAPSNNQPFKGSQNNPATSIFGTPSAVPIGTSGSTASNPSPPENQRPLFGAPSPFGPSPVIKTPEEKGSPFSIGNTQQTFLPSKDESLKEESKSPFTVFPGNTLRQQSTSTLFGQQTFSNPPKLPEPAAPSMNEEAISQTYKPASLFSPFPGSLKPQSTPSIDSTGGKLQAESGPFAPTASHAASSLFKLNDSEPVLPQALDSPPSQTEPNGYFQTGPSIQQRQEAEEEARKKREQEEEERRKILELERERERQKREMEEAEAKKRETERQEAAAREATREALRKQREAREEAKRQAEAKERAQRELEQELQAGQREIARRQAAEKRAAKQEAARRASIEADITKRKADDFTEEPDLSYKRASKAARLTPEDELSVEELMKVDRPRHKRSQTSNPQPSKPAIDEDELLLSAARLAAHTLSQGARLWDETPSFSQSVSSASSSFFGRSSTGSRPSFDGSHAVVNGYDVALAPSSPLGLGRTLSRTEQRIRATGANGLAFKPITRVHKPSKKIKEKGKEPQR